MADKRGRRLPQGRATRQLLLARERAVAKGYRRLTRCSPAMQDKALLQQMDKALLALVMGRHPGGKPSRSS